MAYDSSEKACGAFFGAAKTAATSTVVPVGLLGPETAVLSGVSATSLKNEYSGTVLRSVREIRHLKAIARHLRLQDDPMLDPDFFLASVSQGWAPRIVAVYRTGELVAIVYAKERIISGVPTGVVYADGSLGEVLLANPLHQQNAFCIGVETLLSSRGIRSVRVRLPACSSEVEALLRLAASRPLEVQVSFIQHNESPLWKYHAHLPLPDTYDQFLQRLGGTTRHNFRYYRRRFEASGHKFIQHLSTHELRLAALDLAPKSRLTSPWRQAEIDQVLNMVTTAGRPLAIGLKHQSGEWLSVLGGWYRPGGAVLCFQCNNERDFGSDSLSTILRAYLIEFLIQQGLGELVIWADTGPPLSRYVSYTPTACIALNVRSYCWRAARLLLSKGRYYLPKRLAVALQWIA